MNREYTECLFKRLPAERCKKILHSKIKSSIPIPGFRRMDSVPLGILKNTIKSNEQFAVRFLDAVANEYGCSSEQYTDENCFPELTQENFWGLFARKCKDLDGSQESGNILGQMLREYEELATSNLSNDVEDVVASSVASGDLGQEHFGVADNKTDGLFSIESEEEDEDYMSEFTQYIGYVQEANGYYNFWPIYVVHNGTIERFNTNLEMFPQLGNLNLSSTPWDYVRKKCYHGEILVITISSSDLIKNRKQDGFLQKTNYKIDFNHLELQGRIKRLEDIRMYPVFHPMSPLDFKKKAILIKEKYIDTADLCLIEESKILYGPYRASMDEENQIWVDINPINNNIVNSYRSKNGMINYIEIDIDIPDYPHIITDNVYLDDSFICQPVDTITDQDLLKLFQRSLSERKDGIFKRLNKKTREKMSLYLPLIIPEKSHSG